jgi:hypothetical protein
MGRELIFSLMEKVSNERDEEEISVSPRDFFHKSQAANDPNHCVS